MDKQAPTYLLCFQDPHIITAHNTTHLHSDAQTSSPYKSAYIFPYSLTGPSSPLTLSTLLTSSTLTHPIYLLLTYPTTREFLIPSKGMCRFSVTDSNATPPPPPSNGWFKTLPKTDVFYIAVLQCLFISINLFMFLLVIVLLSLLFGCCYCRWPQQKLKVTGGQICVHFGDHMDHAILRI